MFLRQGSEAVQEVRLFLLGHGRRGKTSLARALQAPSGLAEPIHEEDRTVGLNVWRGWRPGGGRHSGRLAPSSRDQIES